MPRNDPNNLMSAETCFVLTFSEPDKKALEQALIELGYDAGSPGLKEFILDSLLQDDPPSSSTVLADRLSTFIAEHPEQVGVVGKAVLSNVKSAFGSWMKSAGR